MTLYAARADEMLTAHGFRRTSGRIALVTLLAAQTRPVRAEYLLKKLSGDMDEVTLYRALEAFITEGMLVQYDFGHGHGHYELAHDRPHHHHAVCEICGKIEDVPANDSPRLTAEALKRAPGFSLISRHSLEFYGQCVTCAP